MREREERTIVLTEIEEREWLVENEGNLSHCLFI